MEYRTLAHTDLTLSAITFGSRAAGGWMWGKSNRDEAVKAIKAAYDGGVTSIDTAGQPYRYLQICRQRECHQRV